jgi:hypothetical protein
MKKEERKKEKESCGLFDGRNIKKEMGKMHALSPFF